MGLWAHCVTVELSLQLSRPDGLRQRTVRHSSELSEVSAGADPRREDPRACPRADWTPTSTAARRMAAGGFARPVESCPTPTSARPDLSPDVTPLATSGSRNLSRTSTSANSEPQKDGGNTTRGSPTHDHSPVALGSAARRQRLAGLDTQSREDGARRHALRARRRTGRCGRWNRHLDDAGQFHLLADVGTERGLVGDHLIRAAGSGSSHGLRLYSPQR